MKRVRSGRVAIDGSKVVSPLVDRHLWQQLAGLGRPRGNGLEEVEGGRVGELGPTHPAAQRRTNKRRHDHYVSNFHNASIQDPLV